MENKLKKILGEHWLAYTFAACAGVVLYWLLTHLFFIPIIWGYVSPVIWGVFFAYLINPLVNCFNNKIFPKMKRKKVRHIIAVLISLLIVIVLLTLLGIAFVPPLVDSVKGIVNNMDVYSRNLKTYLDNISKFAGRMNIDVSDFNDAAEEFIQVIVTTVTENTNAILKSFFDVGTGIVNIGIGIVLAVYFLFEKEMLLGGIAKIRKLLLSKETYARNNIFWKKCNTILTRFMMFDILEGFIIGIINMIFMLIFRMPYVALISVIVGLTNLIPTLGPIIGGVIGTIILVLVNPLSALLFVVFSVALQTFDASLLKPQLFGDSFGVPSVWIFIAIVVGGKLAGVVGVLLAVPVAAIITYALQEIIIPTLENRGAKQDDDGKDEA